MKNWLWFSDNFSPSEIHMHGFTGHVFEKTTQFQELDIVNSPYFGRMLILDGDVQSSEKDEFIYHEAMVHPAMLLHPDPKNVLIMGGGEGATAREVLKHKSVEKLYMVDIDEDMIDAAKKYLPSWHQGAFDDPRMHLVLEDARKVVGNFEDGALNVIISDLTEPFEMGPSFPLFTKQFAQIVYNKLDNDGIYVLQASILRPLVYTMHAAIRRTLKLVFPIVRSYAVYVESFDTPWSFIIASKGKDPMDWNDEDLDKAIEQRIQGELKMYDSQAHWHMFCLPKNIRHALEKDGPVLDEENPVYLTRKGDIIPYE
ncbi:fused MFS/spermidine synthase [Coprothermobacter platensis]|uniref:fused MFS/spermidine synthase n=1 Tax=Coprothermobacter platensis TaxID=108819 RepID=UPI0003709DBD|nr:fused MFS/spermidine synthase [Coprothermobacter platensis]